MISFEFTWCGKIKHPNKKDGHDSQELLMFTKELRNKSLSSAGRFGDFSQNLRTHK